MHDEIDRRRNLGCCRDVWKERKREAVKIEKNRKIYRGREFKCEDRRIGRRME